MASELLGLWSRQGLLGRGRRASWLTVGLIASIGCGSQDAGPLPSLPILEPLASPLVAQSCDLGAVTGFPAGDLGSHGGPRASAGDAAAARELLTEVAARFGHNEGARAPGGADRDDQLRRLFGDARGLRVVARGAGGVELRPEGGHADGPLRPAGTRAAVVFPERASDGLRVSVQGRADLWLEVRPPLGAPQSVRTVIDGLVVYCGMVAGADVIYVPGVDRLEEYVLLRTPEQAAGLVFDVVLSPGLSTLRVDASGAGLEALGADGGVALRAPAPEGRDAQGGYVGGRLQAGETGQPRHWRVSVRLTTAALAYPVLLDPSWAGTGTMASARRSHTATLLPGGKVLLVGGTGPLKTAELYDSGLRTYAATGQLGVARGLHTATLLDSGQVLIAGGYDTGQMATAELYDPDTGTFTPTSGPLGTGRDLHTATLLASGKVLIAGGLTPAGATTSAELYDPVTRTFGPTGALAVARGLHTATRLDDGAVLLVGGLGPAGVTATAERYYPETGKFLETPGDFVSPRSGHAAALLASGEVLIVGSAAATAELFNPSTGLFSATGSFVTARNYPTATVLRNGRVLIAGGSFPPDALTTTEVYDPGLKTFAQTEWNLQTGRFDHTATLLPSGAVLAAGGRPFNGSPLASGEVYDPGAFTNAGEMLVPRSGHAVTLLTSGKVLISGGWDTTPSAELYDPATGLTTETGPLIEPRKEHGAVMLPSGRVLLVGGSESPSTAEVYDPSTGLSAATGALAFPARGSTQTLLATGEVLVIGGSGTTGAAQLFDPSSGVFTALGSTIEWRYAHTAVRLGDGRVLITGGEAPGGVALSAELYDPGVKAFSVTGQQPALAQGQTATLLPAANATLKDGRVLLTGGWTGSAVLDGSATYLPDHGIFTPGLPMGAAHASHSAALLPSGHLLIVGGYADSSLNIASPVIRDPVSATFSPTASLLVPRTRLRTTVLPSGRVLVVGGTDISTQLEVYDPARGHVSATGPLSVAPTLATATVLPLGQVLVVGTGVDVEYYNPNSGAFEAAGTLSTPRKGHSATARLSGNVLVAGGDSSLVNGTFLKTAELFDLQVNSFVPVGSLDEARAYHTATLLASGQALIAGGQQLLYALSSAVLYDESSREFTPTGALVEPRSRHTATMLPDGRVLLAGGHYGNQTKVRASAELYDPTSSTFATTGSMGSARWQHTATLLPSGDVLVVGGYASPPGQPAPLASAELFDPKSGTFTPTGALGFARAGHCARVLPSGQVLIAGGNSNVNELYDPVLRTFSPTARLGSPRSGFAMAVLPSGQVLIAGGTAGGGASGVGGPAAGGALASAELYDEGFGFANWMRPILFGVSITARFYAGTPLSLGGQRFLGAGEGSSGSATSSATNYPLARLVRDGSEQVVYAPTRDPSGRWRDATSGLIADLPKDMPGGTWRLSLVTSGIQSDAVTVSIVSAITSGAPCAEAGHCLSGFCVDGVCCASACEGGVSDDCQACAVSAGAAVDGVCGPIGTAACGGDYVPILAVGAPVTESFDALSNTSPDAVVPTGWRFAETGTGANGSYAVSDGSAASGDTYSYGAASSTDRALGLLTSGAVQSTLGALFGNDTGRVLAAVHVTYTGEQWRLGALGRLDRLDFQYSTHATDVMDGNWVDVPALAFNAPQQGGSPGALYGDDPANQSKLSFVIEGLALSPGAALWVRWNDFDPAGADDGLAVDDFALTALCAADSDCDDSSLCTADTCSDGLCEHVAVPCDDGNACTTDSCAAEAGCVVTHATGTCDDNNACTTDESCSGGACLASATDPCSDGNACTADSCDPLTGCEYVLLTVGCNDNDNGTKNDMCAGGQCVGQEIACPAAACQSPGTPNGVDCLPTAKPASTTCDDGEVTTKGDHCDGEGGCAGTAYACEPAACQSASVANGTDCTITQAAPGTPCDDGDACTTADICGVSACIGTPTACDDGHVCVGGQCTSTYCVACDDSSACGGASACLSTHSGQRCLLACGSDEDCLADQECGLALDGSQRCLDETGDCSGPTDVEPGPEEGDQGAEAEAGVESGAELVEDDAHAESDASAEPDVWANAEDDTRADVHSTPIIDATASDTNVAPNNSGGGCSVSGTRAKSANDGLPALIALLALVAATLWPRAARRMGATSTSSPCQRP